MFSVSNAMLVGPASFSAMHPSAMQIFLCLFGSDLPFRLVLEESQNIFGTLIMESFVGKAQSSNTSVITAGPKGSWSGITLTCKINRDYNLTLVKSTFTISPLNEAPGASHVPYLIKLVILTWMVVFPGHY